MTLDLDQFRAGRFSLPGSSRDELPPCCGRCLYLAADQATVCFCDASYYFCTYSWPDKLTETTPPCLQEV
jgi:hypothetical protein